MNIFHSCDGTDVHEGSTFSYMSMVYLKTEGWGDVFIR